MPSEAAKETMRRAWRELGFFGGRNHDEKEWRIVGSVKDLRTFADEVHKYASNPANDLLSDTLGGFNDQVQKVQHDAA
jgi:hypothetical protein